MFYDKVRQHYYGLSTIEKIKKPSKVARHPKDSALISKMDASQYQKIDNESKKLIDDAVVVLLEDNSDLLDKVQDINLEDFKNIKFPFPNIFIETYLDNQTTGERINLGIQVYEDSVIDGKSLGFYNAVIHLNSKDGGVSAVIAFLKTEMLPRFYIDCWDSYNCKNVIHPQNFGAMLNRMLCMKTERTSEYCNDANFVKYCIKTVIYVVNLVNTQPKTLDYANRQVDLSRASYKEQQTKSITDSKYIYIRTKKPIRYKAKNIVALTKRKSPKPHRRRGHYRHYQSGKVIWVEMSYIGLKEIANKKTYKIKTA